MEDRMIAILNEINMLFNEYDQLSKEDPNHPELKVYTRRLMGTAELLNRGHLDVNAIIQLAGDLDLYYSTAIISLLEQSKFTTH